MTGTLAVAAEERSPSSTAFMSPVAPFMTETHWSRPAGGTMAVRKASADAVAFDTGGMSPGECSAPATGLRTPVRKCHRTVPPAAGTVCRCRQFTRWASPAVRRRQLDVAAVLGVC